MSLRSSKYFRIFASLAAVLLLLGTGLVLLPEILRRVAVAQLDQVLAAPVSIEDVDLNLFTGRGSVSRFVMGSPKESRPLVQLPRLDFNFWPLGLLRGRLTIHSLVLSQPDVFLVRTGPARFNLMEVVEFTNTEREAPPALAFTIEQFAVRNGTLLFLDRTVSPQFERTLKNVTLTGGRISSLPKLVVTPTSFELRLSIDGGSVTMTGEATPIARPAGIQVTAHWENLNPATFEAYLPAGPVLDLSGSRSSGEARYLFLHEKNETHRLTASFTTGPMKFYTPDERRSVLSLAGSDIRNVHWDFLSNQGGLEEAILKQPRLLLERTTQGVFPVTRLFDGGKAAPAEGEPAQGKESAAVPFAIDHLRIERGVIEFVDHKVKPNVKALFEDLQLTAKSLSISAEAEPSQVTAEARLGKSPVRIEGHLKPYPFASRLQISTQNLPLEPYEGYWRALWHPVDEWSGSLDGKVELTLATHEDDLGVKLSGQLAATKLMLGFSDRKEPPFQARRVDVRVDQLRTHPTFFLDVNRLQISGAELEVRRDADGNLNLRRVWAGKHEGTGSGSGGRASSTATKAEAEPPFIMDRLLVKESSIRFVDATVKPAFKTILKAVSLEIGKLGRQTGFSPVKFEATVEETAKLELKGSIQPFDKPVQIKLDGIVRDYDLAELNPYATKFIRYEIARGRVTTDVEYSYDAGDLTGQNQIAIRHLQLGDRLGDEFEERVGVSLRLAIALLEDADGTIRLSVPVSGNLTDPQFDFGHIVWRAVRNAIVSFLSAPLRLLGNIVTFGGRITEIRVEPVEFQPGSVDLKPSGEKQVTQLAQLFKNKPKLELELRGIASPQELDELKRHRLRRQIEGTGEPYDQAIRRLYRLASDSQAFEGGTLEEIEAYLAANVVLPQNALEQLAAERASYLEEQLAELGVEKGRLYVDSQAGEPLPGRVEFELLG